MSNKHLLLIPALLLTACTAQPSNSAVGSSESAASTDAAIVSSETEMAMHDQSAQAGDPKGHRDGGPTRPDGTDSEEVNGLKAEDINLVTTREDQSHIFGAIVNTSDKERKLVAIKAGDGVTVKLTQDEDGGRGPGRGGRGGPGGPGGQGGPGQEGQSGQHDRQHADGQGQSGDQNQPEPPGGQGNDDQRPQRQVTTLDHLTIPAKGTVELRPGDVYGLIEQAGDAIKIGEKVAVEFVFDDDTTLKVDLTVAEMPERKGHDGGRGPGRGGIPPHGERGGRNGQDDRRPDHAAPQDRQDGASSEAPASSSSGSTPSEMTS